MTIPKLWEQSLQNAAFSWGYHYPYAGQDFTEKAAITISNVLSLIPLVMVITGVTKIAFAMGYFVMQKSKPSNLQNLSLAFRGVVECTGAAFFVRLYADAIITGVRFFYFYNSDALVKEISLNGTLLGQGRQPSPKSTNSAPV